MPSVQQLRSRLLQKLSELFQLDQPDLDFGFYRIMHAKSAEVQDFIGTDLLKIVADAFGDVDEARKAELKEKIAKEIAAAKEYGVADPENSPKVKEAEAAYETVKDTASAEADVYDHLYRFFERYYDDGDFISRRYYTRETSGKAAPFAVPYNGEEVKLHWANADQYYIKSAEYFSNFTFDLRKAQEIRAAAGSLFEPRMDTNEHQALKVHFKVVEATEGEHGNVKASEQNKRFFIIHKERPVEFIVGADPCVCPELVVNFEYRPDPEKNGQENTWRDKRNAEAVESILQRLEELTTESTEHTENKNKESIPCPSVSSVVQEYLRLFKVPAPTEKDKKRPVLAKYVNQYTARNTMDYFIHKDLGGFLRRELDFYIKNEIMRLDDIENADAPAVESYLAKIKVLRKIAGKLIDFLAQLEDFQKKLWLKKKFIVETNYCITLDRVPEELFAEVAACDAQCEEWIKLFAIDEIQADLLSPGFSRPLTVEFLKANNKLVLDTRFFDDSFKVRLVASIENFDEQCDGLLVHSENFQALNLLQERYREQVKCIYIDPPYNTGEDGFIYKDGYQDSTWLCCLYSRIYVIQTFFTKDWSSFWVNIDDNEAHNLKVLCDGIFGRSGFIAANIWQKRYSRENREAIGDVHDYIFAYSDTPQQFKERRHKVELTEKQAKLYTNPNNDPKGRWRTIPLTAQAGHATKDQFYEITAPMGKVFTPPQGRCWGIAQATFDKYRKEGRIYFGRDNNSQPNLIRYLSEVEGITPWTWWPHEEVGHTDESKKELYSILKKETGFDTPKPSRLMKRIVHIATDKDSILLDYFAGSGTTGQAVISLNREDGGKRKLILVEMGDYFDTVLKPRIAKVVYSDSWKYGKPTARHTGISHCFKYIRLESYEDTLNNLRLDHNPEREKAIVANPSLKEDYMLRYLLDVETRGSQSLLNIDAFADPTGYTLDVKKPGTDEYATRAVDLIETFNYLIGLRVLHTSVPQTFQATFKRITDPELPADQHTKLVVGGRIRRINEQSTMTNEQGTEDDHCSLSTDHCPLFWFRKVEGWVPKDSGLPNNGQQEKVLIVWRKLTSDIEQDNLMLDEWFQKNRISTRDFEFDTIYVNGSNNLPNLALADDTWKVRLIEEEFMKRMWEVE